MDRCVNCGIAIRCNTMGKRSLEDHSILSVFREWLSPQIVTKGDYVCQACWDLAQNPNVNGERLVGHRNVCLRCGKSLASRPLHRLHTDSTRELRIYNVIQEWIHPRTIQVDSRICHACWIAADRAARRFDQFQVCPEPAPWFLSEAEDVPKEQLMEQLTSEQKEPTITLPDYMRACETESKCCVEGCKRKERNRVPIFIRKKLLTQHKYYIPEKNRLCDNHFTTEAEELFNILKSKSVQSFTAKHIQNMLSL